MIKDLPNQSCRAEVEVAPVRVSSLCTWSNPFFAIVRGRFQVTARSSRTRKMAAARRETFVVLTFAQCNSLTGG